jgi:hypothetical protein
MILMTQVPGRVLGGHGFLVADAGGSIIHPRPLVGGTRSSRNWVWHIFNILDEFITRSNRKDYEY